MTDTNGYTKEQLAGYLTEIDAELDELASLKGSYMESCRGPRSTIKDIKGRAKEGGINPRAFAEILHQHITDRAEQKRLAGMEPDDLDAFKLMEEALGDFGSTELGSAALDRAKPKAGDEVLDSLGA